MRAIPVRTCLRLILQMVRLCHSCSSCAGWVERNKVNNIAYLRLPIYSSPLEAALQGLSIVQVDHFRFARDSLRIAGHKLI